MKNVVVLGSTGSIGKQALDVVRYHPELFRLIGISGKTNKALLQKQAEEFRPAFVAGPEEFDAAGCAFLPGEQGISDLASLPEADIVVNGISGFSALKPLISSLQAGKTVALANKESIVCGSPLIRSVLEAHSGTIVPVDSEQSALFQCMNGERRDRVRRLILTASGGPFWQCSEEELKNITVEQALKHPVWNMGSKITIDSSTLFNKGLEVMEAAYLFDMPGDRISVLIHPQSIVHSMVEYDDGTVLADMSTPDMRLPIQYAMTYPDRVTSQCAPLDLSRFAGLTFFKADPERYPAIRLAYECLKQGGACPIFYNAANEVAVGAFVRGEIRFTDIVTVVSETLQDAAASVSLDLDSIIACDREARRAASSHMKRLFG